MVRSIARTSGSGETKTNVDFRGASRFTARGPCLLEKKSLVELELAVLKKPLMGRKK
jgi:hypothetical protein